MMMAVTYTLEEVARMSNDAAVRAQFDARNLACLRFLAICFGIIGFAEAIGGSARANFVGLAAGLVAGTLSFIVSRAARRTSPSWPPIVRRHVSATIITFVSVQIALIVLFNAFSSPGGHITVQMGHGAVAWSVIIPILMVGFRMPAMELGVLHLLILLLTYPLSASENGAPFIGSLSVNAMAFGYELSTSRRMRKQIKADWSERSAQAREQVRMRDELRYARELQLNMLPERAPQVDWLDLSGASQPATEVGGDYFDYFLEGDCLAVVCADVAGHGMASFLFLSALRSGFMLLRGSLGQPAAVLEQLRHLVEQTSRRRMLVTVSVVLFDPQAKRITIASAGHPPIVVRYASGHVELIELFAPPLGARLPVTIPQRNLNIGPGDIVVMHSDGVYECRGENGEAYGLDRLMECVRASRAGDAESLRDEILRDVERFRGAAPQDDDVTVVVARVK